MFALVSHRQEIFYLQELLEFDVFGRSPKTASVFQFGGQIGGQEMCY
jgi:hypothetical protein